MAGTLIARELHKAHGAATILAGVSVTVAPGDVLGVVGPNGAGKSTLLRLLAGIDRPDRGTRAADRRRRRLPAAGARPRARRAAAATTWRAGPASPPPTRACTRPRDATGGRGARRGGAATPRRSRRGSRSAAPTSSRAPRPSCATSGWTRRCSTSRPSALSGGQAARAVAGRDPAQPLRRPAARRADQRPRLRRPGAAGALRGRAPGGAVIVSHDRAFLARTVTRVLEIDEIPHTAAEYGGGWAGYLELRGDRRPPRRGALRDLHAPARPADRPRRPPAPVVGDRRAQGQGLSDEPDKNVRRARTERSEKQASKVRASEKAIERLEEVEKPWRRWELQLRFGGGERSGDVTVRLERAVLRRGSFTLGPLDLELAWGERVALVGPNGTRQDDARRGAARQPPAGRRHPLDRPRRADRDARPGARGLRRRRRADRRVRRPERADRSRRRARCWPSSASRATRSRARRAASPRASAPARASRC